MKVGDLVQSSMGNLAIVQNVRLSGWGSHPAHFYIDVLFLSTGKLVTGRDSFRFRVISKAWHSLNIRALTFAGVNGILWVWKRERLKPRRLATGSQCTRIFGVGELWKIARKKQTNVLVARRCEHESRWFGSKLHGQLGYRAERPLVWMGEPPRAFLYWRAIFIYWKVGNRARQF